MTNRKRISKIINLCFLVYLVIFFIITFKGLIPELKQEEILKNNNSKIWVEALFQTTINTIIKNFWVLLFYLAISFANRTYKKEKLSKADSKYSQYYRDILNDYAPSTLSFVDQLSIDNVKESVADLLSLEIKHKIKLGDKIEVIDNNGDNLTESQKYILSNIRNGKLNIKDNNDFFSNIAADALKFKLVEDETYNSARRSKEFIGRIIVMFFIPFILVLLWMRLAMLLSYLFSENVVTTILIGGLVIGVIGELYNIYKVIYIGTYLLKKGQNPYIRTKLGENINEKLEGLKNYIKEYGLLKDRGIGSIILWEDYLIYSLIFGQNKQIIDDTKKYLNIEIKELK